MVVEVCWRPESGGDVEFVVIAICNLLVLEIRPTNNLTYRMNKES